MTASNLRVRRATVEDLDALRPLWTSMRLSVVELEPRLTEFQIVEDAQGKLVGGIGFQIGGQHGRLHNEGFTDFALADVARDLLWGRLQTLASNHGILRIWTQENSPFWKQTGFKPADADALEKLPGAWKAGNDSWLTLQLKDENAIASVEKELAMLMSAEKKNSQRVFQRARTLRTIATFVALLLAIAAFAGTAYLLLKRPELLHPGR